MVYQVKRNNLEGGWDVIDSADRQPLATFKIREDAIGFARRLSTKRNQNLQVYDEVGQLDWELRQSRSSVEFRVYDPGSDLPSDVAKDVHASDRGKPLGPTQPSKKRSW